MGQQREDGGGGTLRPLNRCLISSPLRAFGAAQQLCMYLSTLEILNNHPDDVDSKAVLPTAWLVKLKMPLGSDSFNHLC